ncbi:MAG: signal peptidase II [Thermodesulfobacteriota bacterium]
MSPEARTKLVRLLLISGGVAVADQVVKLLVNAGVEMGRRIPVVAGFFDLTHWHNQGGAFGLLASQGPAVRGFFFFFLSFLAVVLLAYLYRKTPAASRWFSVALCLTLGGAVGNLIDRVRLGYVDDFLLFYVNGYYWPAFNVADAAVTVGAFMLVAAFVTRRDPL